MIRALVYLQWCTWKNRVRTRLRRLKEPRYLIGGIVGLLYFYSFFLRHLLPAGWGGGHPGRRGLPPGQLPALGDEFADLLELGGAFVLLGAMALAWLLPSKRAALEFTEAEVQFLFPAPVGRRALIHYKLWGWQVGLLFTSLIFSLVTGRLGRWNGAWMAIVGGWVVLFLVQLHGLGASFARSWLQDRGLTQRRRQRWVFGALLLIGAATIALGWRTFPPAPPLDALDVEVLGAWIRELSAAPPLTWVLIPLRWIVRLMLVREMGAFLQALGPVLALVVIHYVWVIRANVAFEEASVEAARATADRLAAARRGDRTASRPISIAQRRRRARFELRPEGPAWMALVWKNLLAAGCLARGPSLGRLAMIGVPVVLAAASMFYGRGFTIVLGGVGLVVLVLSVVLGPAVLRFDFRQDLVAAGELLKVQPLAPWQVVVGEVAGPWLILTLFQWAAALVAMSFLPDLPGGLGAGWGPRVVGILCAAVLAPALGLVNLLLQNGAALLFPAWILTAGGTRRGGIETMGQQIIVLAGQMIAFLISLLPALLAGGVTFALLRWGVGNGVAAFPAALAAALVLLGESALLTLGLASLWQRLDLSREQF